MKIAYIQPRLSSRGGAERVLLCFLNAFSKKYDIDILTSEFAPKSAFKEFENYKNNIKVVFPKTIPSNFKFLKHLEGYDLIIASSPTQLVALCNKTPVICYAHSPYRAIRAEFDLPYFFKKNPLVLFFIPLLKILEKKAFERCSYILANSKFTLNNLQRYNLLPDKTPRKVIYPPTNVNVLKKTRWDNYFLYVSRIDPPKRQHLAIQAFNKALKSSNSNYKLILAGSISDAAYYKYLNRIKGPNVEILTNLHNKEVANLYKSAYACLFCAKNEDFGLTPVEAQAFGKIVLVLGEGGCLETVINNKTGFLIKNVDELSKKIIYLIDNPKILRDAAPKCIKNAIKFSERSFVEDFAKVLEAFGENK